MVTTEERAITALKLLPPDKQEEVLNFIEFLQLKLHRTSQALELSSGGESSQSPSLEKLDAIIGNSYQQQAAKLPKASLGQRLREIRARIVASGEGLSTIEEIEQEISEQRNRLGYLDE